MSRRVGVKGDAPKKDKKQAASLARRMAGKKAQTAQLQVEVHNEEDWEKLLAKEGLIVIDVYSDWSGPCIGMNGNLKKARVELGDYLHLAIAKNDEIEVLSRFRNRSEPTWLFAAGGQLITVVFGANAPKLLKLIDQEVKQEMRVLKGETWRRSCPFTELCDEERERIEASEKIKMEAERLETERIEAEKEEKRMKMYTHMAEYLCYETVIICFPHTIDPEFGCVLTTDLEMFCRPHTVYISTQHKMVISKEIFNEIFFRDRSDVSDDLLEDLASGPCLVMLLKSQIVASPGQEGEKRPGDIERQIFESLNIVKLKSDQELIIPSPSSIPAKYPYVKKTKEHSAEEEDEEEELYEEVTSVPGCWTPASYFTKCAAVRFLFPARAEKVLAPEEPPVPAKMVIAFDLSKQKECYDLIQEFSNDVLNIGYFSGVDPTTAEHLCATPEQYKMLPHNDSNRLVLVVNKTKSEPLLSFAGIGAAYISLDEATGKTEADLFFPPGVEPRFTRLEEAELAQMEEFIEEEQEEEEVEEEESLEQDEDDLMALLGLTVI